jgi:hypothetical protein
VCGKSCNSDSSPEPSAAGSEGGGVLEEGSFGLRVLRVGPANSLALVDAGEAAGTVIGGYATFIQNDGLGWLRAQSVALGRYGVSRWDTGCGRVRGIGGQGSWGVVTFQHRGMGLE